MKSSLLEITGGFFREHPVPGFLLDHEGAILASNRAAEDLFGPSLAQAVLPDEFGKGPLICGYFSEEYRESAGEHIRETVRNGSAKLGEIMVLDRFGEPHWAELHSRHFRDNGDFLVCAILLRDREKEYSDKFLLSQEKNNQVRASERKILSNFSYELRSQVKSLQQLSALLVESIESGDITGSRELAATVNQLSAELSDLVPAVEGYRILENANFVVQRDPFTISDLIETISSRTTPRASAGGLKIFFSNRLSDDRNFEGDKKKIIRILQILLTNAIQYTPAGQVDCIIREEELSPYLSELSFEVRDTGPGIPPALRPILFQGDSNAMTESGSGLAIAKDLSSRLGGQLYFETTSNFGTSFFLTLPVHRSV